MDISTVGPPIGCETHPDRYQHWRLEFDGPVAFLSLNVKEDAGLRPDYSLKLNSYDLAVDIELADAVDRLRFEHPEVHAVVIRSARDRVFCAGANIFMLAGSGHAFKVNFCKFTNETRLGIEEASAESGLRFLAAVNGICAGGGYELALACDEIILVDDGSAAVSLPETPLLGVLPGTGGLTRLTDKRKVRRDLADLFCTLVEGIKGRRAVEWRLVDRVAPTSRFNEVVVQRARELAAASDRPASGPGIALGPLGGESDDRGVRFSHVTLAIDAAARLGHLTVRGPAGAQPETPEAIAAAGDQFWPLRVFRELNAVLFHLRFNAPQIGTVVVRTEGDVEAVRRADATLLAHWRSDWLVREIVLFIRRTLKRMDQTARSFISLVEPGACFAGTLFELALASDRIYMLDDPQRPTAVALSGMNGGPLPMANGLSRLQTRFLATPELPDELLSETAPFDPPAALDAGLVTSAPDELDWDDEVRLAIEARTALSPDALTGMEQNLRFAGPETMETKIFARLSAWQNWIFQRPNAVGEKGALKAFGAAHGRPEFDWTRT
jgi:benzoyl-CoA-dihydrodiol lyase